MSRPRRVLGYARVSSEEQALGTSLSDQQDAIRSYASSRGLHVAKFYVEAQSAIHERVERREQIRALMRDARAGDLVLCDKLDRWSRDPEFTYRSMRELREVGASVYFVGDACDPSTPEGDTMLNFRVLFAKEEHKRIKLRMVGTRNLLRAKGYYAAGVPPLGYRRPKTSDRLAKNVLEIVPNEADLVRRIFLMYVGGWSMTRLANELGLKLDRVKDALHRRVYLGEVQGPPSAPGKADGEWIKGAHEPIISADLFARAQRVIAERTLGGPRPRDAWSETSTWFLRDIARCSRCGAKAGAAYAGPKDERRRHYYRCTKRCRSRGNRSNNDAYVPVREVEAASEPMVVARLQELRRLLGQTNDEAKAPRPIADFAERRAKLQARRERVLVAFEDGHIDREQLRQRMAKLDTERLRIDAEEADRSRPSPLADVRIRRELLGHVRALAAAWKHATAEERRAVVNQLAVSVAVEAGRPPRFSWRTAEELAMHVT